MYKWIWAVQNHAIQLYYETSITLTQNHSKTSKENITPDQSLVSMDTKILNKILCNTIQQ